MFHIFEGQKLKKWVYELLFRIHAFQFSRVQFLYFSVFSWSLMIFSDHHSNLFAQSFIFHLSFFIRIMGLPPKQIGRNILNVCSMQFLFLSKRLWMIPVLGFPFYPCILWFYDTQLFHSLVNNCTVVFCQHAVVYLIQTICLQVA